MNSERMAIIEPIITAIQHSICVQRERQVTSGIRLPSRTTPVTRMILQTAINEERDRKATTLSLVERFIGDFRSKRMGMLTIIASVTQSSTAIAIVKIRSGVSPVSVGNMYNLKAEKIQASTVKQTHPQ